MKRVRLRGRFLYDLDQMARRLGANFDAELVAYAVELLGEGKPLPASFKLHPLEHDWAGFMEFHLDGDWLVIYRERGGEIWLHRTGTHADLFKRRS